MWFSLVYINHIIPGLSKRVLLPFDYVVEYLDESSHYCQMTNLTINKIPPYENNKVEKRETFSSKCFGLLHGCCRQAPNIYIVYVKFGRIYLYYPRQCFAVNWIKARDKERDYTNSISIRWKTSTTWWALYLSNSW